jgi:hypothetical protein
MVAAILDRPTLILNRSWQPVGVAPVSRSLILLWNDNAHVVDPHVDIGVRPYQILGQNCAT